MPRLPKLKIQYPFGNNDNDLCDLEQAKNRIDYGAGNIVTVEEQVVSSHEGLVQLASMEQYRDKEFLEVMVVPLISGG